MHLGTQTGSAVALLSLGSALIFTALPASSRTLETATIDRPEEFIELEGSTVPELDGVALDEIFVFAWKNGGFSPIVFQIDERGPNDGYSGEDTDPGVLDGNDQIVFMVGDVGDRASERDWVAEADTAFRYEIEVADPLHEGAKGWVYLFRGTDLPRSTDDYVSVLSDDPFDVDAWGYRETYVPGLPAALQDLYIKPAIGGSGVDVEDLQKFRLKLGLLFPWQTEEDGTFSNRFWIDGPVRVIHGLRVSLPILDFDISNTHVFYYKQMTVVKNIISQLYWPEAKQMVWCGDYLPSVTDMIYYDNRGPDPEADATFTDVVDGDGLRVLGEEAMFTEWTSATHGASISVQDNSVIDADSRETYYCDGCEEDVFPDTGDGVQWGQSGTWLKGIPFSTETFLVETWNTRLGPSTESRGGEYARRYLHRTTVTATVQHYDMAVQDRGPGAPAVRVTLGQNVPNPFNPRTAIPFHLAERLDEVDLGVFDPAGRRLRVLWDGPAEAGDHIVEWDGRDDAGRPLPSGVYVARLTGGGEIASRRLLLLK